MLEDFVRAQRCGHFDGVPDFHVRNSAWSHDAPHFPSLRYMLAGGQAARHAEMLHAGAVDPAIIWAQNRAVLWEQIEAVHA